MKVRTGCLGLCDYSVDSPNYAALIDPHIAEGYGSEEMIPIARLIL